MNRSAFFRFLKSFLLALLSLSIICAVLFALYQFRFAPETPHSETSQPAATETVPSQTETTVPSTEPPQTVPTQPPIVETARATITVTGDIMSHIPLVNAGFDGSSYNYDGFFKYISGYASQADLAVVNLETTLAGTENGDKYSGFPRFNCPDAMADALKNAGFDLILTANNHSYDTGSYGMNRTLEIIADRGLLNLGTTRSAEDPKYLVKELNGIRVGMVCYTYGQIDESTGQKSINGLPLGRSLSDQINVFDYDRTELFYEEMATHIADMKAEGADALVVFIHWGNEYKTRQNSHQETIAQKLCDLGIDVIVGGHPHVIQPVELLTSSVDPGHRTLCAYSVGNALSNQRSSNMDMKSGHTEDGMLFSFSFIRYSNGEVFLNSVDALPTWIYVRKEGSARSYDILPLDSEITDWQFSFSIGDSTLRSAQESYDRTLAIIGDGLETANAFLEEQKSARELEYDILINGVG